MGNPSSPISESEEPITSSSEDEEGGEELVDEPDDVEDEEAFDGNDEPATRFAPEIVLTLFATRPLLSKVNVRIASTWTYFNKRKYWDDFKFITASDGFFSSTS